MAFTLKNADKKTKRLAIAVDEDPEAITIEYSPRAYNAKLERQVNEAAAANLPAKSMIPAIIGLVKSWDLRPDEEEPIIALTEEGLEDVPTEILSLIVSAIGKDQNPNPPTGEQ